MPDLPEFLSCARNAYSLVGRVLNPECQAMKNLLFDMYKKWQKVGRVKDVALSKKNFQFIFKSGHDLKEVLDKGAHTFDEWALAIDRWFEFSLDDYLQTIPIWVQLWDLPINYKTIQSITALGELIGQLVEVAFDPEQAQIHEFVRVKVIFNVSRSLRRSKIINLPNGDSAVVMFLYERIQKRCYECQKLTHEKDYSLFWIKKRKEEASEKKKSVISSKQVKQPFSKPFDPLFGVLREDQVGLDSVTGRPRISADVLEGMRQYLIVSNEDEKLIRIERVKKSISEAEKDPLAKKVVLSLEQISINLVDLMKNKGLVFQYEAGKKSEKAAISGSKELKLLSAAIKESENRLQISVVLRLKGYDLYGSQKNEEAVMFSDPNKLLALFQPFQTGSRRSSIGSFDSNDSGPSRKYLKSRKRPSKAMRLQKPRDPHLQSLFKSFI